METQEQTGLLRYGMMAEDHWREFLPQMVKELEARGALQQTLMDAQEKTADEMYDLMMELRQQGLTAQQAHDQAWEMVRERYIFLKPEAEQAPMPPNPLEVEDFPQV